MQPFPHTCTYRQTYKRSATRQSGSCTSTSGMLVKNKTKRKQNKLCNVLKTAVADIGHTTRDTFFFSPDVVASDTKMPEMTRQ